MKKIAIIALMLSACITNAQDTLSLHGILTNISNNSDQLKMYDAQARSQKAAAKGAFAWEAPQVGGGFWMTPYNPKYYKGENGMGGMGQYMLSAQQMFPNHKKQQAEFEYMNAMAGVTSKQKEAMQNDLFAAAKKNFYEWIILKKKMDVIAESETILNLMIKTAELKYKNNTGDITAYYKAKAGLAELNTMKVHHMNEMEQKMIALNTLMQRDKMHKFEIDTSYVLPDLSGVQIDSLSLLNNRSDIAAINREIQITHLEQNLERQKLRPEFGLKYDHMIGIGTMPAQFNLMAMVKLPFANWSSKGVKAKVESLEWQAASQQMQREAVINETLGEAHRLRSEIQSRQKQVQLYEQEIIPALRRNYETTRLAYEQNTEKLFVLFDAWDQFNKIQMEYLDLLQQLFVQQAELERILEIKEQ